MQKKKRRLKKRWVQIMSNDIEEDMKNKISAKYKEMTQNDTITDFCEKEGISEATFHKYKKHEQKIEEESPENKYINSNGNNFENDYQPDKKEKAGKPENELDDDDDDDDEDIELTIG